MRKLLVVVVLLLVAIAALGYWREWFNVGTDGKVQSDPAKFKQDKEAFSKTVGDKAKALKDEVASLWKKSEGLTGDDKVRAQEELGELKKKHDRLEQQIKDLEDAGQERFESIKQDLSKSLGEVDKKIEELSKKFDKGKAK